MKPVQKQVILPLEAISIRKGEYLTACWYCLGWMTGSFYLLTQRMWAASNQSEKTSGAILQCSEILTDIVSSLRKRLHQRLYWLLRSDRLAWWFAQNLPAELLWYVT